MAAIIGIIGSATNAVAAAIAAGQNRQAAEEQRLAAELGLLPGSQRPAQTQIWIPAAAVILLIIAIIYTTVKR